MRASYHYSFYKMPKIYVCVDPGGSQTKVIYQLPKQEKPQYLLMPPELEEIKYESLLRYLSKQPSFANPAPIKEAYLSIADQIFAVGEFASEFYPEDRIREIKYENALYKVLAVVGIILESNQIKSSKIQLYLSILLPWNEYEDRGKFKEKIEQYLSKFTFRKKEYSISLKKFICRPEGGGLAELHDLADKTWQQSQKIGFLMLGHRNISALIFDQGKLSGESPLIGLSQFFDEVIERTSMLNRERIASAVFTAIDNHWREQERTYFGEKRYETQSAAERTTLPNWSESESIEKLTNARDLDLKAQEITKISSAIEVAEEEYWSRISKFLARIFPAPLDAVIISGGASLLLKPRLEKHFNNEYTSYQKSGYSSYYVRSSLVSMDYSRPVVTIIWGEERVSEIEKILDFKEVDKSQSLSSRLIDAYGLFKILQSKK